MMKTIYLVPFLLLLSIELIGQPTAVSKDSELTVSFGSCNKQYKDQPLWDDILEHQPDFFFFLGDNIYGDTDDMAILEDKYQRQKNNEAYQKVLDNTQVWGVWDDHDYGKNDAGKEYSHKKESAQLFWDFFNVPEKAAIRERKGVYSAVESSIGTQEIKFIFLDARYHRDPIKKINKGYKPNQSGTILGEQQWQWLEDQLSDPSKIYIIASGIQFISKDHKYEKWANFPNEREKLFQLIEAKNPKGVLFLSGDRHIAEISVLEREGLDYPLVDVTSSGLTHTWSGAAEEYNEYREGELIAALNYGLLIFRQEEERTFITAEIRGEDQSLFLKKSISF